MGRKRKHRPQLSKHTEDELKKILSTVTTPELCKTYRVTRQAVSLYRIKYEIPNPKTYPFDSELGTMTDYALAAKYGTNYGVVRNRRKRMGIASFGWGEKPWHKHVGTRSDYSIAEEFGVATSNVCAWRHRHGIPKFVRLDKRV